MDDHVKFTKSDEYGPFMQKLGETTMAGMPNLHHVCFSTPVAKAAVAPITEMLTLYFTADVEKSSFESIWERFVDVMSKNSVGYLGSTGGWVVEDLTYDGQPGKAYVAVVGWESFQAHMAYRETQAFKDTISEVRGITRGGSMHHTKFTKPDKA
jgi:heme-degrading monooxygenase HmoA